MLQKALALFLSIAIGGCSYLPPFISHVDAHPEWESYDQANLKKNDYGCPYAVWIAPSGELEQCP